MSATAQATGRATGLSAARLQRLAWQAGIYLILLAFLVLFLYPFVWILASALKTSQEISRDPLALPTSLNLTNLVEAWTVGRFSRYLGNSVVYSVSIVSTVLVICGMTGYALGSLRFPGRDAIFTLFVLGLMVPFQSVMIPLYYLLRDLQILGTYWAMIVPGTALGLSFGIFLMRAFFRSLPAELADAARIDGCGEWGVYWRVMLPLAMPGLTTLAVFQFMWTWNAFLMPLLFVQKEELRPVSLGVMYFFGRYTSDRGLIAAGVVLGMIPIVALYLVLQRQFIRGITAGAMKG